MLVQLRNQNKKPRMAKIIQKKNLLMNKLGLTQLQKAREERPKIILK